MTSHWVRAPFLDRGGDDHADAGTDTTVPEDDAIALSDQATTTADIDDHRTLAGPFCKLIARWQTWETGSRTTTWDGSQWLARVV